MSNQVIVTNRSSYRHQSIRDEQVGILVSYRFTNGGIQKSYQCQCGGEFWPA